MDYDFDYEPSEKELGDLIERWETAWEEFLEERAADEQPYKYPLPKKLIDPIDRGDVRFDLFDLPRGTTRRLPLVRPLAELSDPRPTH